MVPHPRSATRKSPPDPLVAVDGLTAQAARRRCPRFRLGMPRDSSSSTIDREFESVAAAASASVAPARYSSTARRAFSGVKTLSPLAAPCFLRCWSTVSRLTANRTASVVTRSPARYASARAADCSAASGVLTFHDSPRIGPRASGCRPRWACSVVRWMPRDAREIKVFRARRGVETLSPRVHHRVLVSTTARGTVRSSGTSLRGCAAPCVGAPICLPEWRHATSRVPRLVSVESGSAVSAGASPSSKTRMRARKAVLSRLFTWSSAGRQARAQLWVISSGSRLRETPPGAPTAILTAIAVDIARLGVSCPSSSPTPT